jgi:hypothetical protein
MATFGSVEYKVVTGTIAGIATFNTDVETQVNAGYAPVTFPFVEGTNISVVMLKGGGSASFTQSWAITIAPTVGIAGAGVFTIAGDVRQHFPIGFRFTVVGSTGNNGVYTVRAEPTFSTNTTIPVVQAVASAVVDGTIIQYAA